MTLANEAGYLYVYSKKLSKINKEIKHLSKKVQHHANKHANTNSEGKKAKHKRKHETVNSQLKGLVKEHDKTMQSIMHHYSAFSHALQKNKI
jgi:septal ring factor EnvC (AmiA/AmiB activator)